MQVSDSSLDEMCTKVEPIVLRASGLYWSHQIDPVSGEYETDIVVDSSSSYDDS